MVDASNHQIGLSGYDGLQGQFDAIGGCARTFVDGDTFRLADEGDGDGQLRRDGTSMPERGPSGATTMMSAIGRRKLTSSLMPLAKWPSSLEMSMRGRCESMFFIRFLDVSTRIGAKIAKKV